jgi:hypothetical protein
MPALRQVLLSATSPIISGLDIATFHSESACGSREASDSGVGTRTRRGCGKLENGKTLIGARPRYQFSNFQHDRVMLTTRYDNSTNVGDLRKKITLIE